MSFRDFFRAATRGDDPYQWQEHVAERGLPEVIDIETGAGKTAGVVIGWLWRLLEHPDSVVRETTPRWLILALPMRTLVEQTAKSVRSWLDGLEDVAVGVEVYVLMGGEGRLDAGWRERPGQPTVLVGTIDMLASRALNRGYASSRWVWPVEFGLVHTGTHWVFDEVQLMGPALGTSRQLDAFRRSFSTLAPCRSTWMSATVNPELLATVDNPAVPEPYILPTADRQEGQLADRLSATRHVAEIPSPDRKQYTKALAAVIAKAHVEAPRSGSLTIAMVNTVNQAIDTYKHLKRTVPSDGPRVTLLHSRFRPADRERHLEAVPRAGAHAEGPGHILVATQVVEAGVDLSATTLVTEAAPWPSVVQRAGRCNRTGRDGPARLLWVAPRDAGPYEPEAIAAAVAELRQLEGREVTSTELREIGKRLPHRETVVPLLRRRDLLQLFDTAPDLVGNDVDISRFIRESDDMDIFVCWREPRRGLHHGSTEEEPFHGGPPRREELCRVSIRRARDWLKGRTGWIADPTSRGQRWARLDLGDLRPGRIVVVPAAEGGYDPDVGFLPTLAAVVPVVAPKQPDVLEPAPVDETPGDDPATFIGRTISLADHLDDAQMAAESLIRDVGWVGVTADHRDAAIRAAALHDLGKAHPVFQATMLRAAHTEDAQLVEQLRPLAKSGSSRRVRHSRPHFRHELVSALVLRQHAAHLLGDLPRESWPLVTYLVGAHHGRVRMAIRSLPDEQTPRDRPDDARIALGVVDGDAMPEIDLGSVVVPPTVIDLSPMEVGAVDAWSAMASRLLGDPDIGPFRLAALEALVRVADWRASALPGHATASLSVEKGSVAT